MQKKRRLLADQDIKDVAQYVKERSYLELEKARYLNFGAFLHTKASARINQDTDYRKGDLISSNALNTEWVWAELFFLS